MEFEKVLGVKLKWKFYDYHISSLGNWLDGGDVP